MHELGIARDFWAVIKQQAAANGLNRITRITIVLGEASGIEADFVRHSLVDHILQGTMAENAELEFIVKPLEACCNSCKTGVSTSTIKDFSCPACGSPDIAITSGKESYVQSIEGE
jgi:hydrogenase nickel incorporation protein HypA/HybF